MTLVIDRDLIRKIRDGRKVEHRIPVRKGKVAPVKACHYGEGRAYDIRPDLRAEPTIRVQIAAVSRQRLIDMTDQDAKREGFHALEEFQTEWMLRHEKAWISRREWVLLRDALATELARDASQDLTDFDAPQLTQEELDARWAKIAIREVWVLTLSTDIPLYLAPILEPDLTAGAAGDIGYTERVSKALSNEEVVPPDKVEELPQSKEAKARYKRERAQREAAYSRLTVEEKVKLATKLGQEGHIDVAGPLREIERQADRAIRRGLRKAA